MDNQDNQVLLLMEEILHPINGRNPAPVDK